MGRSGLGKGLGALIGTPAAATPKDRSEAAERVHQIELTSIVPSTLQPRKDFARDVLLEFIVGVPLVARAAAHERRLHARQRGGVDLRRHVAADRDDAVDTPGRGAGGAERHGDPLREAGEHQPGSGLVTPKLAV